SLFRASIFISSRMYSGKRKEIVLLDGFRFGKIILSDFSQSKYSDESFFAQNSRSSSSCLNSGIFFSFFISDTNICIKEQCAFVKPGILHRGFSPVKTAYYRKTALA